MRLRINIDIKVNRVVKFFVLSDLFLLAGWGFVTPIFAVFIIQKVVGATLVTVGVSAGIYWILRSILQVPIANSLDRTPGEKDDFYALVMGLVIAAFASLCFALVHEIWELYLVQAIQAVGFAFYAASWPSIFSRHLDKDKISLDWTADGAAAGVASGISGLLGGFVAEQFGFGAVFILGAVLSLCAAFVLMGVPDLIIPKSSGKIQDEIIDRKPGTTVA